MSIKMANSSKSHDSPPTQKKLSTPNTHIRFRDQARGRLGLNGRLVGRNFALNGTQGEVGVSLKKKKIFFF